MEDFKEIILENIDIIDEKYQKGECIVEILYELGITRRVESVQKQLHELHRLTYIDLDRAEKLLNELEDILGDDSELYGIKTSIELGRELGE